jgi:hypothetical protein
MSQGQRKSMATGAFVYAVEATHNRVLSYLIHPIGVGKEAQQTLVLVVSFALTKDATLKVRAQDMWYIKIPPLKR